MVRRIVFTESSSKLGGQALQLLQQMAALRKRGMLNPSNPPLWHSHST